VFEAGLDQKAMVTVFVTVVVRPGVILIAVLVMLPFVGPTLMAHPLLVFEGLYTYITTDIPFVPAQL
jgi:hypothetical protein